MHAGMSAFLSVLLLAVFALALIWCCKKYVALFLKFPNITVLPFLLKYLLMEDKNVPVTSFLLLAVFALSVIWYCKKYIAVFLKFPNNTLLPFLLKYLLIEKKNVPATSYFLQTAVRLCRRFESEGLFILWGHRPYLCIFDEEAMKVFSNEHSLIDKVVEFEMIKEVFGSGLLTSNGDKWRKRKKMLNPIFHITMVKDKVSIVSKNAVALVEMLRKVTNEPSIEILTFLQRCSFINISEFLIGRDFNDTKTIAELEKIMEAISKGTKMVVNRMIRPWLAPRFMMWLSSEGREYIKMMEEAHENAKKILKERTELFISTRAAEKDGLRKHSPPSFTEVLIEHHLKDPSFTFDDMMDEFSTFVSAGYDTLSYGMMWCLFLLGHHQEVQDLIYEEVETVLSSDMTYAELNNFRYTDCVIKEALRLYPPIPLYGRVLAKPVSWGKYTAPEGTPVIFFPYMAHRNPDVFPDPEKFDPDRFLDSQSDKKPTTYSFAEGMRNCLGKKFAEIEMKITLAHIIRNFKVTSLDSREDIKLNWTGFLTTVEPLRMRLVPRTHSLISR